MIIVNDNFVIKTDEHNYIVCANKPTIKTKDGKTSTEYPVKGYFGDLGGALRFISDEEVRISLSKGDRTLLEALTEVRRVRNEVREMIDAVLEGEKA